MAGFQLVMVDAVNNGQIYFGARRGNQHFFGAGVQMGLGFVAMGEDAGALINDVHTQFTPRQIGRIAFRGDLDRPPAKIDAVTFHLDVKGEGAVHGIPFQKVGIHVNIAQIVDADHFDVFPT